MGTPVTSPDGKHEDSQPLPDVDVEESPGEEKVARSGGAEVMSELLSERATHMAMDLPMARIRRLIKKESEAKKLSNEASFLIAKSAVCMSY